MGENYKDFTVKRGSVTISSYTDDQGRLFMNIANEAEDVTFGMSDLMLFYYCYIEYMETLIAQRKQGKEKNFYNFIEREGKHDA